jgi:hypothetical protein
MNIFIIFFYTIITNRICNIVIQPIVVKGSVIQITIVTIIFNIVIIVYYHGIPVLTIY